MLNLLLYLSEVFRLFGCFCLAHSTTQILDAQNTQLLNYSGAQNTQLLKYSGVQDTKSRVSEWLITALSYWSTTSVSRFLPSCLLDFNQPPWYFRLLICFYFYDDTGAVLPHASTFRFLMCCFYAGYPCSIRSAGEIRFLYFCGFYKRDGLDRLLSLEVTYQYPCQIQIVLTYVVTSFMTTNLEID